MAIRDMDVTHFGPSNCSVCQGKECLGGNNKKCVQRDPRPSILAGILDIYGGLRFVVTYRRQLKEHIRPNELAVIVPHLLVHEPLAWGNIPYVVNRIETTIKNWLETYRPNSEIKQQIITLYKLRCLESPRRALNLEQIVET